MKNPQHNLTDNSDFFNYFFQSILSSETLVDFETTLMAFMRRVLKQNTCIFYSNVNSDEDKTLFTLQRGSYSEGIENDLLRKTFPKLLYPKNHVLTNDQNLKLKENFFSLLKPRFPFLKGFQKYSNYIRCGVLLRGANELHGILLYEKPLSHPYLSNLFRLQQMQEYLSLALVHRETVNYATLDQLTHLHRKHYFLNRSEKLLKNGHSRNYQILMIDIDYFKKFNDTYGHLAGDHCLHAIAKSIKHSVRTHDLTGRFGGEEFICLVQSDNTQILTISERIHTTVSKIRLQNSEGGAIPTPTVSIGIAHCRPPESLNDFIERADKALYQAKLNGRNQTFVFED